MASRRRAPSPFLNAASAMMGAIETPFLGESKFRHTFEVEVTKVHPDPNQPRQNFEAVELDRLASTLSSHGQLQPILVVQHPDLRDEWMIAAGERRWRAAKINGWEKLVAIEHVGDRDEVALIENLQRADLSAIELARGIGRLTHAKGWTQNRASEELGMSQPRISGLLRILSLPEGFLNSPESYGLSENVLVELARQEDEAVREKLITLAGAGRLTVQAIRQASTANKVVPASPTRIVARSKPIGTKDVDKVAQRLETISLDTFSVEPEQRKSLQRLRSAIERILSYN